MKTAIITGASSGLGAEFVRQLRSAFPEIECIWLIARRKESLEKTAECCRGNVKVIIMPLDLTKPESLRSYALQLESRRPDVRLLINNAGCGVLGNVGEASTSSQTNMVDINVRALTAITSMTLPYMQFGSHIINISSIASFCANARMTVYSSTKAYVSSFTRGLAEELRPRGISVTAVCPGPMDTEFLPVAGITDGASHTFDVLPRCDVRKVVSGAYRASKAGQVFYTPTAFYKFYRLAAKILPGSIVVKLAKT